MDLDNSSSPVTLSLDGKVALITGGSRGIGAATVRLFARAGARVCFSYRSATKQANDLMAECGGEDVCFGVRQQLDSAADGRALVNTAVERFGRLDALVVNHGVWPAREAGIDTMEDAQWQSTLDINLNSVFGLVQRAVAQMKLQSADAHGARGHIVLIASTAAQRGEAFHADYAASKGALISLTKSLSSELASEHIYVNCVAPGWVETEMSAPAINDPVTRKKIFATIPVGRVGKPEEIAGPVLFLCTPYAGFISGEVMNVNGGAVLVG
jgi:3-oxoacyl-[acyl-carrier protein] reductase